MTKEELLQEIKEYVESPEFVEAGGTDADGNVDFGPAGEALKDFVDGLEEDEADVEDENAEGNEGSSGSEG